MTAIVTELNAMDAAFHEQRASERLACTVKTLVIQCGTKYECTIINISAGGACLKTDCRLKAMQMLRLEIEGFGGVTALVRWTAGDEAGVSFQLDNAGQTRLAVFLESLVDRILLAS